MSETSVAGRTRSAVAKEVVEALHDIAQAVAAAINEFSDPLDRSALIGALQALQDVALAHDDLGSYGIYPAFGSEEAAVDPSEVELALAEIQLLEALSGGGVKI